ncbi:MAG: RluA family pseudouridine synthase [Bacilli bacterium]|nr:RluA family pseudouridine synthase [Bacilli bacterium]
MKVFKIISRDFINQRIDKIMPILDKDLSRSQIQKLIKNKAIFVNDQTIKKANYLIKINDEIKIKPVNQDIYLAKENIPIDILYEDNDLLIVNKQRGLVVHPGNGNKEHTLVNALLYHIGKLSRLDNYRPGIVHRLDKDTSGMLLIAKNNKTHRLLAKQFLNHKIHREYKALVNGVLEEDEGKIVAPISRSKINPLKMCVDPVNGKNAESSFKVLKRFKKATLVLIELKQGRTHQIRVHFEYIKHPIVGDKIYGLNNKNIISDGQILHAYKISFIHPTTNKKMVFKSKLPNYFLNAISRFKFE